jgi:hypothetical protein
VDLVRSLRWSDVDPSTIDIDVARVRRIAEEHLSALGDDAAQRTALVDDQSLKNAIDRDLVAALGPWAAGWNWDDQFEGGPLPQWCPDPDDSAEPTTAIELVVRAVFAWRDLLHDVATRFDVIDVATAGLALDAATERAAARLLPYVLERTSVSDAWYKTFAIILGWYLERAGHDPSRIEGAIDRVVKGRFESWVAPDDAEAAATCAELGRMVKTAAADDEPRDGLTAWLAVRDQLASCTDSPDRVIRGDGHRRFIDERDARDPVRAARMCTALAACRASAQRGEPLTYERLASWQTLVLGDAQGGAFRTTDAYAKSGRERYPIAADTCARFAAALSQANEASPTPTVRAARAYLDVCFFHPFSDGNARAARLALDHVLTSAGMALHAAEPLFVVSRPGDDRFGAYTFAWLVNRLAGTRSV